MIEGYLRGRAGLRAVVLLVDVRRGLEEEERQLIEFLRGPRLVSDPRPLEVILVATKLDKLSASARKPAIEALRKKGGRVRDRVQRRDGRRPGGAVGADEAGGARGLTGGACPCEPRRARMNTVADRSASPDKPLLRGVSHQVAFFAASSPRRRSCCARGPGRRGRRRRLRREHGAALRDERPLPPRAVDPAGPPADAPPGPRGDLHPHRRGLHAALLARPVERRGATARSWRSGSAPASASSSRSSASRAEVGDRARLRRPWLDRRRAGARSAAPAVGSLAIGLLVACGVIYSLGAVVYALRRPDPFPRVFGYHEVFHAIVIVASVCLFAHALVLVMRRRGPRRASTWTRRAAMDDHPSSPECPASGPIRPRARSLAADRSRVSPSHPWSRIARGGATMSFRVPGACPRDRVPARLQRCLPPGVSSDPADRVAACTARGRRRRARSGRRRRDDRTDGSAAVAAVMQTIATNALCSAVPASTGRSAARRGPSPPAASAPHRLHATTVMTSRRHPSDVRAYVVDATD